jgi:hypothetical protein
MKNIFKNIIIGTLALIALSSVVPTMAFAQAADKGVGSSDPKDSGFQLVSCTGVVDPRTGKGTVCDYAQLIATASRILQYVFYILVPITILMILFTGFKFLTAGSEPAKLEKAKSMLKPLIIGIILMMSAYVIVYKFILGNLLADQVGGISKTDIINSGGTQ